MSKLLEKIPERLVFEKRGSKKTGRYGLYVEAVAYVESSGWLAQEVRIFVTDQLVGVYRRRRGRKSGRWEVTKVDTEAGRLSAELKAAAIDVIVRLENLGYTVALRGDPILFELSPGDLNTDDPSIRYSLEGYGVSAWGERIADTQWSIDAGISALELDYDSADDDAGGADDDAAGDDEAEETEEVEESRSSTPSFLDEAF